MNKLIKFLIVIWLAIGFAALVLSVFHLIKANYYDALYFLGILIVAIIMFFINKRRFKLYTPKQNNSTKA